MFRCDHLFCSRWICCSTHIHCLTITRARLIPYSCAAFKAWGHSEPKWPHLGIRALREPVSLVLSKTSKGNECHCEMSMRNQYNIGGRRSASTACLVRREGDEGWDLGAKVATRVEWQVARRSQVRVREELGCRITCRANVPLPPLGESPVDSTVIIVELPLHGARLDPLGHDDG